MFSKNLRIAIEAASDGAVVQEIEHVIYAQLLDFAQLENAASMEHQEQWELKIPKTDENAGSGGIRIRKIWVEGGEPTYELTAKVKKNTGGDKLEVTVPANENIFQQFRFLSERGMIKDRYRFPVQGTELVWEVDVFKKPDGSYHNWCKIDLEVKDRSAPLPELPIQFGVIIMPEGMGTDEKYDREKSITNMYEEVFLSKNQFLAMKEEGVTSQETDVESNGNSVDPKQTNPTGNAGENNETSS